MALRKKKHDGRAAYKNTFEHNGITPYLKRWLEHSAMCNFSADTIKRHDSALRRFIEWCDERGITEPQVVTKPMLERYQRHLFYYRKADGKPLGFGSQNVMLAPVKGFFKWLCQQNYLLYNPASEICIPRKPKALPRTILSVDDIERVFAQADVTTPNGLRDRAILELFYASGIRRAELLALKVFDLHVQRRLLFVREGKGGVDRMLPVSERACAWLEKYINDVRPLLTLEPDDGTLFLTDYGEAYKPESLVMVKRHLRKAGIDCVGSCHLFRHAMATHMLDNGADIRFIQAMLGHGDLNSTQIYTRVSVEKLREIHNVTHPMAKLRTTQTASGDDDRQVLNELLEQDDWQSEEE